MYVACEGRLVAVVDGAVADIVLAALRAHPLGAQAAVIGHIAEEPPGIVLLKTAFGGTRLVDLLVRDPLPVICCGAASERAAGQSRGRAPACANWRSPRASWTR